MLSTLLFLRLSWIEEIILAAREDSIDWVSTEFGLPKRVRILSTWLSVLVPGKIALPLHISPMIHPMDHISTGLWYLLEPKMISGALYHLVAMYSVLI